jgi:hypothetical protein
MISKAITDKKMHWRPVSRNYIVVTFLGNLNEEFTALDRYLFNLGLRAVNRRYDKRNSQVITIYQRTLNVG